MTTIERKRLEPEERRKQILDAAVAWAAERGFHNVNLPVIAEAAGVAVSLISRYFGTVTTLRHHVMAEAISSEILPIIAAGVVMQDPQALAAPEDLRKRALESIC